MSIRNYKLYNFRSDNVKQTSTITDCRHDLLLDECGTLWNENTNKNENWYLKQIVMLYFNYTEILCNKVKR